MSNRPIYIAAYVAPYMAGASPTEDTKQKFTAFYLLDTNGNVERDSLLTIPDDETLVVRTGSSVTIKPHPFGRKSVAQFSPTTGHIYYGWTDSLAIVVRSLEDGLIRRMGVEQESSLITEQDIESAVGVVQEGLPGFALSEEILRSFEDALRESVPETWPAFDTFLVDEYGRTWVDLTSKPDQENQWLIFDQVGNAVGRITLPARFEGRAVRDNSIYGVMENEFDVPRIVRLSVRGLKAGYE